MYIHIFVLKLHIMRIDEEIKSKFTSEYQKAIVNIIYTSNWLENRHSILLKPFGISTQQFNLLRILRGQHPKPASVNLLIDRMLDKTSNASRLVEKLRKKELVERRICEADRRQVDVLITNKGLDLLKELDIITKEFHNQLKEISEHEIEMINNILDKLRITINNNQ